MRQTADRQKTDRRQTEHRQKTDSRQTEHRQTEHRWKTEVDEDEKPEMDVIQKERDTEALTHRQSDADARLDTRHTHGLNDTHTRYMTACPP